jgi:hypothetical protein
MGPCDLPLVNCPLINGANQLEQAKDALHSSHCLFSWNIVPCDVMLKGMLNSEERPYVMERQLRARGKWNVVLSWNLGGDREA